MEWASFICETGPFHFGLESLTAKHSLYSFIRLANLSESCPSTTKPIYKLGCSQLSDIILDLICNRRALDSCSRVSGIRVSSATACPERHEYDSGHYCDYGYESASGNWEMCPPKPPLKLLACYDLDSVCLRPTVWWRKCCGRRVEMISGSTYHSSDNQGQDAEQGDGPPQVRNPLLCFLCDDYYSEPCLLGCYHTFCARCLRGRELDSKIACPLCGQQTMLRDGTTLPPADLLMRQLIDLANAENPPCANCDKRDKTSMYFCSTCGSLSGLLPSLWLASHLDRDVCPSRLGLSSGKFDGCTCRVELVQGVNRSSDALGSMEINSPADYSSEE
uniref:RING-type domain-containing protein n=1 Tax=Timema genevievae TaxID=629358 RepID=A0A7R9JUK8_TIMGE|nr:unnamed protein product [Timema genevievae]